MGGTIISKFYSFNMPYSNTSYKSNDCYGLQVEN